MTKRGLFLRWFIPAAFLYAAGFTVAARWDLAINQAVYNPGCFFCILMETYGWYPAFLPLLLLGLLWLTQPGGSDAPRWRRGAGAAVVVLVTAVLCSVTLKYLSYRGLTQTTPRPALVAWASPPVIILIVLFCFLTKIHLSTREKLSFFAFWGCVYLVFNQFIITFLKLTWSRPRFDDMKFLDSLEIFRHWFQPLGPGGSSFPSGHTANAAGIFILLFLCDLFSWWNKHKQLIYVVCWGYIAAMAASRIIIGRHFLSDTLAASAIIGMIFYAIHTSKIYINRLYLTLKKAGRPPRRNSRTN